MRECIRPNVKPEIYNWQSWRDQYLWTLEINDLLQANLDSLKLVHNYYITPTQKYMTFKDGINLLTKDSGL